MRSRADLMEDSVVTSTDGSKYKDTFTLPLQKFIYRENEIEATLTKPDIDRPDYLGSKMYKGNELEDIVLMLNGIGLLQYKTPGDTIDVPSQNDIEDFYFKYRK